MAVAGAVLAGGMGLALTGLNPVVANAAPCGPPACGGADRGRQDRTGQMARLLAVDPISVRPTQVVRTGNSGVTRVVRRVTGITLVVTGMTLVVTGMTLAVTGVALAVTGVAVTGARVRAMHSGAGATRPGVTDPRHGAGDRRRRRSGTGDTSTRTGRRRSRSTITAITSNRIGTRATTSGDSISSESGYRCPPCELAGRTVAAR